MQACCSLEEEIACKAACQPTEDFISRESLRQALTRLTPKQRQVIDATFFEGFTLEEFSRRQGISFKTAYLHQQRALKKLRESGL